MPGKDKFAVVEGSLKSNKMEDGVSGICCSSLYQDSYSGTGLSFLAIYSGHTSVFYIEGQRGVMNG